MLYDWRGQLVASETLGDKNTPDPTLSINVYDNLDEVVETDTYDASNITFSNLQVDSSGTVSLAGIPRAFFPAICAAR